MERSSSETQDALRRPAATEDMQQVGINGLIAHWVVAIGRWQALTRRGAGDMLFAVVVEQISDG